MTDKQISPNLGCSSERRHFLPAIGLLAMLGLLLYPFFLSPYQMDVARDALIFALLALSLDYLWGRTGVLSFGQAAFFGIGAYSVAIVGPLVPGDNGALAGLAVGITLSFLVAAAVGYFLIFGGVRGAYLTIVTLALTLIVRNVATSWSSVTGGEAGLIGAPPLGIQLGTWSLVLDNSLSQYSFVASILAIVLVGLFLVCRGRYGRMLAALQDDERKLRSLGYNTSLNLLVVFSISAAIAALAGGLYAAVSGFVAPDLAALLLSTQVIVYVALGGRGTLVGPVIGAVLVIRLQDAVSSYSYALWPMILGAFFIAMVFLFPDGLVSLLQKLAVRISGRANTSQERP
jgi:branched-chain amino acid transport system permease protein